MNPGDQFEEPPGGWTPFPSKVEIVGLIAVLLPFVVKSESYSIVNGEVESYSNVPALIGGAIGLVCAVIALGLLGKTASSNKAKRIGAAVLLLAGGGFQIVNGQGAFFKPRDQMSIRTSFQDTMALFPRTEPTRQDRLDELDRVFDACEVNVSECPRAIELAQELCDEEPEEACDELSILLNKHGGPDGEPNPVAGLAAANQGCDAGGLTACLNAGVYYFEGQGTEKDVDKAIALTNRACEGGEGAACKNLGFAYQSLKQEPMAREAYEQACKLKHGVGCRMAAFFLNEGKGGPKNEAGAVDQGKRGCEVGDRIACAVTGHWIAEGIGVEKDDASALLFFEKACELSHAEGCTNLGVFLHFGRGADVNLEKAYEKYQLGCKGENARGCYGVGDFLWRGAGTTLDREAAKAAFARACELGDKRGCELPKK